MREADAAPALATDGPFAGRLPCLTVRNLDAWYDAFGVNEGDKLYLDPDKRVQIW
jgi:predicted metalloendopeptidase